MDDKTFAIFDYIISSLLLVTLISSVVSFAINLAYKRCEKWFKINSISSHLFITMFIILYYVLFEYLKNTFTINYSSTYTYTIINILLVLTSTIIVSINYILKDKIKLVRILETCFLAISIVLFVSMLFSKYTDLGFVLLTIMTLIFGEYFIINTSEEIKNNISKRIYLTTNILISVILLISLISFIIKISFAFDLLLLLIGLVIILIALIPLLTAYINLKKEEKND